MLNLLFQMAFVYEELKFYMMFVKLANCALSIIVAILLFKLKKATLNKLFFLAFLAWGIFIGLDGVLFVIAPNGPRFLLAANIMRDICVIMVGLVPFFLLQVGFIIREGEEIAIHGNKTRLLLTFILNFVLVLTVAWFDGIVVRQGGVTLDPNQLPPTGDFRVTFVTSPIELYLISSILMLSFVVWYFYAVGLIFSAQKRGSGPGKARARKMMFGISMIAIGIVYFVIFGLLGLPAEINMWFMVLGQFIWALAPILVFQGVAAKTPEASP